MEKTQDRQKSKTADDVKGTKNDKVTDPRQILEDLLQRTEKMEKRLARILEECENLGVFADPRKETRYWARFFGR